jgi:F-type H+-transporting ATPase subunit a
MHGHGFNWLAQLSWAEHVQIEVVTAVFNILVLVFATSIALIQLQKARKRADRGLIPDGTLTVKNFFELICERLYNFSEGVMGKHNTKIHFPLIGTLFVYILTSNIIGLLPGFSASTGDLNTTLALGFVVFLYYNAVGLRENGMGHLKHLMGPVWWLAPLMFPLEFISHCIRPIALGFRLRGNIMGDHVVMSIFSDLVPWIVPSVFYGFGIFVALVQAFVFCLLTMIYISLTTAHDH